MSRNHGWQRDQNPKCNIPPTLPMLKVSQVMPFSVSMLLMPLFSCWHCSWGGEGGVGGRERGTNAGSLTPELLLSALGRDSAKKLKEPHWLTPLREEAVPRQQAGSSARLLANHSQWSRVAVPLRPPPHPTPAKKSPSPGPGIPPLPLPLVRVPPRQTSALPT